MSVFWSLSWILLRTSDKVKLNSEGKLNTITEFSYKMH